MPPPVVTPDQTIRALDDLNGSIIRYNVAEGNWASARTQGLPWVPDLAQPDRWIALTAAQVIDIVVLGDGYTGRKVFENQLEDFIGDFFALEVYRQFAGAFRIRALYTQSASFCDLTGRNTYYRVMADDDGVNRDGWWNDSGVPNARFRNQLQGSLDRFAHNETRYSTLLSVGDDPVIHNELAGLKSNLVVVMLVRTENNQNTEGMTRTVDALNLNVGFGSHAIHEFGHAFAYLEDEYISTRHSVKTPSVAERENPAVPSVFTLSNLTFDKRWATAPWRHLSPWGSEPRGASGNQPCPVVGWLWRGGEDDLGVWHSEYHCLMNGRNHENYAYSSSESRETIDTDLRFRDPVMFCLWCQEITVLRILEKTGQLARPGDPPDINAKGMTWYARWVNELRPLYWAFFDLPHQIREREAIYARPDLYSNSSTFVELKDDNGAYRRLDGSDLYSPFEAAALPKTSAPASTDDEELLVCNA